ncbi:hypothetical protein [Mycobacterium canetti]|uniref:hypothetical protein n=1 Tax=Mycobacterium canetti TaxID=78331 RepID=UPI0002A56822|nr:hypothetical protein [Mycobacterium canetti]CCK62601.1 Putative transferase [Mycobacterium canettii CIPT 140070017]
MLTTLGAWVACIGDARWLTDYTEILAGAGLSVRHTRHTEAHDDTLLTMIERIEARITALRITAPETLAANGAAPDTVLAYTAPARDP